jgi:hypothetical protein
MIIVEMINGIIEFDLIAIDLIAIDLVAIDIYWQMAIIEHSLIRILCIGATPSDR